MKPLQVIKKISTSLFSHSLKLEFEKRKLIFAHKWSREENAPDVGQRITQILLENVARYKCGAKLIKLRVGLFWFCTNPVVIIIVRSFLIKQDSGNTSIDLSVFVLNNDEKSKSKKKKFSSRSNAAFLPTNGIRNLFKHVEKEKKTKNYKIF